MTSIYDSFSIHRLNYLFFRSKLAFTTCVTRCWLQSHDRWATFLLTTQLRCTIGKVWVVVLGSVRSHASTWRWKV